MNNKPLISVITVTYNDAENLILTIDSVLKQSYPYIEYIVVDGNSTDNTREILRDNNAKISDWISECDQGIYDAMNKGARISSGHYAIFMNAGDKFYSSDSIQKLVDGATNEADVIYGDHWLKGTRRHDGLCVANKIDHIQKGMVCCHQSMLFKISKLLNQPFSLDFGTAGDYELICRWYSKNYVFCKVPGVVVAHFIAGGISDVSRIQSLKNSLKACKHNLNPKFNIYAYYLLQLIKVFIIKLGYDFLYVRSLLLLKKMRNK
jgi:putative colanic acid biosynthesis glycosyltransferase